jgi:hypothetical protein
MEVVLPYYWRVEFTQRTRLFSFETHRHTIQNHFLSFQSWDNLFNNPPVARYALPTSGGWRTLSSSRRSQDRWLGTPDLWTWNPGKKYICDGCVTLNRNRINVKKWDPYSVRFSRVRIRLGKSFASDQIRIHNSASSCATKSIWI